MSMAPRSGGSAGASPRAKERVGRGGLPGTPDHSVRRQPPEILGRGARRELVERLRRDARRIATHFGLEYEGIDPENARVKRRYGACFSDGRIKIRLTHARTGRPLKYSSMVDTLCHELAHLKHFNHGPRFKAFYFRILDWARAQGIYQPGLAATAGPGPAPERITPPPPGLWGQVEALARHLHEQQAPRPARVRRSPSDRRRPGPEQLGLFE